MKNMKKEQPAIKKMCMCPYCEGELYIARFPFCESCGLAIQHCMICKVTVVEKGATKCPKCGAPLTKGGKKTDAG
jgi:hypothetical protein